MTGGAAMDIRTERMVMNQHNHGWPGIDASVAGMQANGGQEPVPGGWPVHAPGGGDSGFEETARAMRLILDPGQVTELRALDVSTPEYKRPHTVSGYFDDVEALALSPGADPRQPAVAELVKRKTPVFGELELARPYLGQAAKLRFPLFR